MDNCIHLVKVQMDNWELEQLIKNIFGIHFINKISNLIKFHVVNIIFVALINKLKFIHLDQILMVSVVLIMT